MPLYLLCVLAGLTSLITGVVLPITYLWLRRRGNIPLPGRDRLLRPAGESLRLKLGSLNEDLMLGLITILVCPLLITFSLVLQGQWTVQVHPSRAFLILGTSLATGSIGGLLLSKIARRLANHNLGFLGERLVGEVLGSLQGQGCRVFHDIPLDGLANLDHVLVTPTAVFAIETKMRRRKRARTLGQPTYRVRYDGERLHFPFGSDMHGLNQARRNARWLSEFLTKANAAEVPVIPVLALPQWEVHREARGDVTVVSHKELKVLARYHPKTHRVLSSSEIARICFALSERTMCDGI